MSDLADQIREVAELHLYDGNVDQPLPGYFETLDLVDQVAALVVRLAEVERERDDARARLRAVVQQLEQAHEVSDRNRRHWLDARARCVAAEARLEAVRAKHREHGPTSNGIHCCLACGYTWPCPTIRALDAEVTDR